MTVRQLSPVGRVCLIVQFSAAITYLALHWQLSPVWFTTPISILYLTLVPGLLTLGTVGIDLRRPQGWLFVVAASLTMLMILGASASVLYLAFPLLPRPFTMTGLPIYLLSFTGILTIINELSDRVTRLPDRDQFRALISRESILALVLVILTAGGTVLLEQYGINIILLFVLVLCSLSPIFLLNANISSGKRVILLWGVTLVLLYQKALIRTRLAGGDLSVEYHFSEISLSAGYWLPQLPSTRTTSLRLTVLHPIYTLLTDFSLLWEYKIIYPFLFSLTAVAVYYLTISQFSFRIAVTATYLYIFAHPFFALLSLNSRTGQALFFTAVFVLAAVDRHLSVQTKSICLILTFLGALFSHYAVAPLFTFMLIASWILRWSEKRFSQDSNRDLQPMPISGTIVGLITIFLLFWYIYTAEAHMVKSLTGIGLQALFGLLSAERSVGSSGGNSVSLEMPSLTYQFIQWEYMIVLLLCCFGLLFATIDSDIIRSLSNKLGFSYYRKVNRITSQFRDVHPWFLALGIGAAMIVPMSFLPGVSFGIARVYMIVMLFLACFGAASIYQIFGNGWKTASVVSIGLALMLLFNAGVIAATVTHDLSPQPNLIRDEIMNEGSNEEVFHLLRRWNPASDWQQAEWISDYRSSNISLYRGTASHVPFDPPPESDRIGGGPLGEPMVSNPSCNSHIYLTTLDYRIDEVVTDLNPNFVYYNNSVSLERLDENITQSDKLYGGEQNTIYKYRC